jgi:hypothetical protein
MNCAHFRLSNDPGTRAGIAAILMRPLSSFCRRFGDYLHDETVRKDVM